MAARRRWLSLEAAVSLVLRCIFSLARLTLGLCLAGSWGCALWKCEGPVSQQLVLSRQLSVRGLNALERGETDVGEQLLAEAVQTCAVDPEARRHYAESLWRRGAGAAAIVQLDEAIRLSPDDVNLRVRRGELHLANGDPARALEGAEAALDLDPSSTGAWLLRGRIFAQTGDHRRALAHFHRALELEPSHREALRSLANLHAERAKVEPTSSGVFQQKSLAALQALADTYPQGYEPQELLAVLGVTHLQLGRPGRAADYLAAAAQSGQAPPETLFALAEAQHRSGRPQQAWQTWQEAQALAAREPQIAARYVALRQEIEAALTRPPASPAPAASLWR